MTLRRRTSSATAAAASTPYCHDSLSAPASGTAAPRIAPIAAGPAPSRNARAPRSRADAVESPPAQEDEDERRAEGDRGGDEPAGDAERRVPDDGDRLDDGPRRDLAERHCLEELGRRHPVVVRDRVRLHERDDHEPAAVAQAADLERRPGERRPATRGRRRNEQRQRAGDVAPTADGELDDAAPEEDDDEPRADEDGSRSAGADVGDPPAPARLRGQPRRTHEVDPGPNRDRGDGRASSGAERAHPLAARSPTGRAPRARG